MADYISKCPFCDAPTLAEAHTGRRKRRVLWGCESYRYLGENPEQSLGCRLNCSERKLADAKNAAIWLRGKLAVAATRTWADRQVTEAERLWPWLKEEGVPC